MTANVDIKFQEEVASWLVEVFGVGAIGDQRERGMRFLEEAIELAQAVELDRDTAHVMVDYVFDRPQGEMRREVGGVLTCLAVLCHSHNISMAKCGTDELARIWTRIEEIRAKQASKPDAIAHHAI